jgi:hypothetical protein
MEQRKCANERIGDLPLVEKEVGAIVFEKLVHASA